jgi:hypothetical protein
MHESSRDKPQPLSLPSLPGDALVELVVRRWLGLGISFPLKATAPMRAVGIGLS